MTKNELISSIRNNGSFYLRSSEFYEPWSVSEETVKEMANDFYYLLKDVLDYLEGEGAAGKVWHNASEVPQTGRSALIVFEDESRPIIYTGVHEDWEYIGHISMWMYVDDLLKLRV